MERERIMEEVAQIEAFIAAYRAEQGETAFVTSLGCFRAKSIRSVCTRRGIRAQGSQFKGAATKDAYIAALWEDYTRQGRSPVIDAIENNSIQGNRGEADEINGNAAVGVQADEELSATRTQVIIEEPATADTHVNTAVETQANDYEESEAGAPKRRHDVVESNNEFANRDTPEDIEIKRRKLKESSEYVQSLFRTVEAMRAAGCSVVVVNEMLHEAQRQASKLVRESKSDLP
ncbi:unnamed protein product [Phytophthora lilii]|uniref:Unnamed protein product n=1 Tax=Phytophthora lilii TaxID=2077276 RepID=A0A9W6X3J0_9STRA|nr:unnamed protein product [Phytophthora lilii]